ncbi:hypothetical protein [Ammoniphilus sp. YIM 78166]|uniref:hypothetical protein n=1 Tax=Ammoniphilus sp. YIM 78166 TaxID=1644106 RepID=UPI00106FFEF7|nr:hypothetical protein [Ammoniphilus sp. YIM 78166]
MILSEQYRQWLNDPKFFHDQQLATEFESIFEITKEKLQIHVEPDDGYKVREERALSVSEQTAYIKELFDYLYENFVPWNSAQTEEYREKAEEMRAFLESQSIILDTPYFQQNIGRQRLKIIQLWMKSFQ